MNTQNHAGNGRAAALLFSATLFASATLLFLIQPILAKMLLPLLGGTPAVWNICMVFFQALLLAGYAYAHFVSTRFKLRHQLVAQAVLLAAASAFLPIAVPPGAAQSLPRDSTPVFWLLGSLAMTAGVPFFVLSINGPLLQKWFARTSHPNANDPYFLYAASNLGSLLALLGYPFLVEPLLPLYSQSLMWQWLFIGTAILIVISGLLVRKPASEITAADSHLETNSPVTWRRRCWWTALAFVPSSLMLGVTNYFTSDIVSVPLLWIIPLSLYLLTFVFVFARRQVLPLYWSNRILPIAALALVFLMLIEATEPVWMLILVHLAFFFLAGMVCHGRLAEDRPAAARLTEFYLCLSIGGVLGGIFNALVAPSLFTSVVEYPLIIVLACLMRRSEASNSKLPAAASPKPVSPGSWLGDLAYPLALGLFSAAAVWFSPRFGVHHRSAWRFLIAGLPLLLSYAFIYRPARFGFAMGALFIAVSLNPGPHGQRLHAERNFFGVLRVTLDQKGPFHRLYHGTTIHGLQFLDPKRACEPLSYYHKEGPLGEVFEALQTQPEPKSIAAVGLGAGAVVCYAQPGQDWHFYEIDPAVIRIARDTNYFTYLGVCGRGQGAFHLGDARLELGRAEKNQFALIVLDAFSSGSIPMHLLTTEAIQLYVSKLKPNGILAFHVSSRHFDFAPLMGNLANDAGLLCLSYEEPGSETDDTAKGKYSSHWVVMAHDKTPLLPLAPKHHWHQLKGDPAKPLWSDDFSNILSIFRWN